MSVRDEVTAHLPSLPIIVSLQLPYRSCGQPQGVIIIIIVIIINTHSLFLMLRFAGTSCSPLRLCQLVR